MKNQAELKQFIFIKVCQHQFESIFDRASMKSSIGSQPVFFINKSKAKTQREKTDFVTKSAAISKTFFFCNLSTF